MKKLIAVGPQFQAPPEIPCIQQSYGEHVKSVLNNPAFWVSKVTQYVLTGLLLHVQNSLPGYSSAGESIRSEATLTDENLDSVAKSLSERSEMLKFANNYSQQTIHQIQEQLSTLLSDLQQAPSVAQGIVAQASQKLRDLTQQYNQIIQSTAAFNRHEIANNITAQINQTLDLWQQHAHEIQDAPVALVNSTARSACNGELPRLISTNAPEVSMAFNRPELEAAVAEGLPTRLRAPASVDFGTSSASVNAAEQDILSNTQAIAPHINAPPLLQDAGIPALLDIQKQLLAYKDQLGVATILVNNAVQTHPGIQIGVKATLDALNVLITPYVTHKMKVPPERARVIFLTIDLVTSLVSPLIAYGLQCGLGMPTISPNPAEKPLKDTPLKSDAKESLEATRATLSRTLDQIGILRSAMAQALGDITDSIRSEAQLIADSLASQADPCTPVSPAIAAAVAASAAQTQLTAGDVLIRCAPMFKQTVMNCRNLPLNCAEPCDTTGYFGLDSCVGGEIRCVDEGVIGFGPAQYTCNDYTTSDRQLQASDFQNNLNNVLKGLADQCYQAFNCINPVINSSLVDPLTPSASQTALNSQLSSLELSLQQSLKDVTASLEGLPTDLKAPTLKQSGLSLPTTPSISTVLWMTGLQLGLFLMAQTAPIITTLALMGGVHRALRVQEDTLHVPEDTPDPATLIAQIFSNGWASIREEDPGVHDDPHAMEMAVMSGNHQRPFDDFEEVEVFV